MNRLSDLWRLWFNMGILCLFAVLTCGSVLLFQMSTDWFGAVFLNWYQEYPKLPWLMTPILGMMIVGVTRKYFPGIAGSGIPQVIASARLAVLGRAFDHLVSPLMGIMKVVLSSLVFLAGFCAGREGPSVQLGSCIMVYAGRFFGKDHGIRDSDLILAGGAAGLAAAFNTPLAGFVFALEELSDQLSPRSARIIIPVIMVGSLLTLAFYGNGSYFPQSIVPKISIHEVKWTILAGLVCGLSGAGFSALMQWPQTHANFFLWRWRQNHPMMIALVFALLVVALGFLTNGFSFGNGYSSTLSVLQEKQSMPLWGFCERMLATLLSYHAGMPGGIFSPSLSIGAGIGADVGLWLQLDSESIQLLIVLCMGSFLAAMTQAPVTSATIAMELINRNDLILLLLLSCWIARWVSSHFVPEIYQSLALRFLPADMQRQPT
jgi:H+/Cl- antiporter ClcA